MKTTSIITFICLTLFATAQLQADSGPRNPSAQDATSGNPASTELSDIHDIKPLVIMAADRLWLYYAAGAAFLLIAVLALLWYLRRKKKSRRDGPVKAPPLPEETARRMLEALNDFQHMTGKAFYFRLSIIIRRYIEDRFHVGAPEMTTEEFLPRVNSLNLDPELESQLKALLRTADPVKFAGEPVAERRMAADLEFAHRFVDQTTQAAYPVTDEATVKA